MSHRPFAALALAATLGVVAAATSCSTDHASTSTAVASTSTVASRPAPADGVDRPPADLDEVPAGDVEAVASGWGCAYLAHRAGETPAELVDRLGPVQTEAVAEAITGTQQPDHGPTVVESTPGAAAELGEGQVLVHCTTRTLDAQGVMVSGPNPASMLVDVELDGDRAVVVDAAPNGVWLIGGDR